MLSPGQPFLIGINYWPRRKAMFWWSHFEEPEVLEDFRLIKDLGIKLVRIFLLWEDWQPSPNNVSKKAIADLEKVCDIAADLALTLDVTFFIGHMSGPNWIPEWMLIPDLPIPKRVNQVVSKGKSVNCSYRNPFEDLMVLEAAERLIRTVVSHFKDHPAIGIWNLGNEPDLVYWPSSDKVGQQWAMRFSTLIREIDPHHPITCGLHVPSLTENNGLRVHDIFKEVDFPAMHGYPMYADWAQGPLDSDFVPFLCALTTALCGKPTLMEEFGGCTEAPGNDSSIWKWTAYGKRRYQFMASEEDLAIYIGKVLPKLLEVGATGAVLWCFADYARELYHRPPCDQAKHERFFGLIRPDGSLKPHAETIRHFAATRPLIKLPKRKITLDISLNEFYKNPLAHTQRLYKQFLES